MSSGFKGFPLDFKGVPKISKEFIRFHKVSEDSIGFHLISEDFIRFNPLKFRWRHPPRVPPFPSPGGQRLAGG